MNTDEDIEMDVVGMYRTNYRVAVEPASGVRFWTDCDGLVHVTIPYGVMPREVASELEDRTYSAVDDALSDVGVALAGGEGLQRDIRQAVRQIMADAGIKEAEE